MSCYHIEVVAYGLNDAATDALFERVADAAHALDEQVTVSGRIPNGGQCDCETGVPWEYAQDDGGRPGTGTPSA